MLRDLKDQPDLVIEDLQRRQDRRQALVEPHIDDRPDHLADLPDRTGASELVCDLAAGPRRGLGRGRSRLRGRRGGGVFDSAGEEVASGGGARGGPRGGAGGG